MVEWLKGRQNNNILLSGQQKFEEMVMAFRGESPGCLDGGGIPGDALANLTSDFSRQGYCV